MGWSYSAKSDDAQAHKECQEKRIYFLSPDSHRTFANRTCVSLQNKRVMVLDHPGGWLRFLLIHAQDHPDSRVE